MAMGSAEMTPVSDCRTRSSARIKATLNPRMTVHNIIAEPLVAHRFGSKKEIDANVIWLTKAVGFQVEFLRRYPHAFSGG